MTLSAKDRAKRDRLIKLAIQHFERDDVDFKIELDAEVQDDKSSEASDINNEGVERQIRYLMEGRTVEWLERILEEEGVET